MLKKLFKILTVALILSIFYTVYLGLVPAAIVLIIRQFVTIFTHSFSWFTFTITMMGGLGYVLAVMISFENVTTTIGKWYERAKKMY